MAHTINPNSLPVPSSPYIDRFNSSNLDDSLSFRGVQQFHLDLTKEGDQHTFFGGSSSSNRELSWGRTWSADTPQIALLNQYRSCTALGADKATNSCLFEKLTEAKIECKESVSGKSLLRALSEDGIPLQECTLQLTSSDQSGPKVHSFTLHDIFLGNKNKFPSLIQAQLYNILNFLRGNILSPEESALDLKNGDFSKLKSQLTFDAIQSNELGGTFWGTLRAKISTSNPKLFGLANPGKAISFVPGSYEGVSKCSLGEEGSSGRYQTTCVHKLSDNNGFQPTETIRVDHIKGGSSSFTGSPTQVNNWYKALRAKGLIATGLTSSTSNQAFNQEQLKVSHSYFSSSSSSNFFKAPTKDHLLHSFLVPIGLGITAAGLFYAKSNYENTNKKSDLRRIIGGITGIAGAILGIGIASLPFSST